MLAAALLATSLEGGRRLVRQSSPLVVTNIALCHLLAGVNACTLGTGEHTSRIFVTSDTWRLETARNRCEPFTAGSRSCFPLALQTVALCKAALEQPASHLLTYEYRARDGRPW